MRRHYLWPMVAALGGLLAVLAVFIAPAGRAGLLVSLITGLAWPLAILVAVVVFWPQLQPLLAVLLKRVHDGAGVQFGPFSVQADAERVPSPPPTGDVTLANIRFKLKELANGTSIVLARIHLRGQTEPLLLNRFIDLRPTGPRI